MAEKACKKCKSVMKYDPKKNRYICTNPNCDYTKS